ncbi:MAG: FliM/FliN family flagellar motor switch protein [Candidatus Sericytochromatia bacterium]|nr:FliM/FliN family flagellar motor switch protein [Candidatus Tanganyikabacteria bacterium]
MAVEEEEAVPRARKRRKPKVRLRGQLLPLLIGVMPIFMVMALWTRGGAGLHKGVLVLWALAAAGCLAAAAYHVSYRIKVPRSVIHPASFWATLPISVFLFFFGLLNMWGLSGSWALQLSPNRMESPQAWLQLFAKVLLREPATAAGKIPVMRFNEWVLSPGNLDGALWGAVGFACVFGIGGLLASALRREAFDPRQEPFGTAGFWPVLRSLIGYYYGWSLGFGLGAVLLWGLHYFTTGLDPQPPAIAALRAAFGMVNDPNRAFTSGLVIGAWLLSLGMLFMGRGDFTVAFSDPKPDEKEPPMKVAIPELPKTELPNLDFGAVLAETEQIAASFGRDIQGVVRQMGLTEEPGVFLERAEPRAEEDAAEVPVANLLSARKPEFDTAFDEALGQLASVYVQISAQLGQVSLSLAEWLTLEEGSLLEIPRAADGTVAVCINGRNVGRGRPIAHENHVAVKVLRLEPGTVESLKGG